MPPYVESFPVGTRVFIADAKDLRGFMRPDWPYHHPVTTEMLCCAGRRATVAGVSFFHGGDVLYELEDVPGTWQEACLRRSS